MRMKHLVTVLAVALLSAVAFGQKFEVYGDYTYMQFNPSVTGLQSRALNGGGGGLQWNMSPYFGIKADLQGYMSTQWTLTSNGTTVTPHGTIPAGTFSSNATMFTYAFGPVIRIPAKKITPFGELLFGQSNTNAYGQLISAINGAGGAINGSATQHPFTMFIGGGLDWNINRNVALRLAEMDYVLTRYTNPLTQTNNQNNFRYLGGLVFRWGGQ